jgi:hypothetical protein
MIHVMNGSPAAKRSWRCIKGVLVNCLGAFFSLLSVWK